MRRAVYEISWCESIGRKEKKIKKEKRKEKKKEYTAVAICPLFFENGT